MPNFQEHSSHDKQDFLELIPNPIDRYPRTHLLSLMDMMRHGWLVRLFHA